MLSDGSWLASMSSFLPSMMQKLPRPSRCTYATLALAAQQRAANLLALARMGSGPISDAYVGVARKLIGPALVGDQ